MDYISVERLLKEQRDGLEAAGVTFLVDGPNGAFGIKREADFAALYVLTLKLVDPVREDYVLVNTGYILEEPAVWKLMSVLSRKGA